MFRRIVSALRWRLGLRKIPPIVVWNGVVPRLTRELLLFKSELAWLGAIRRMNRERKRGG